MFFGRPTYWCDFCTEPTKAVIKNKKYCALHAANYWEQRARRPCKCGRPSTHYNSRNSRECDVCQELRWIRPLLENDLKNLVKYIAIEKFHREQLVRIEEFLKQSKVDSELAKLASSLKAGDFANLAIAKESMSTLLELLTEIEIIQKAKRVKQKTIHHLTASTPRSEEFGTAEKRVRQYKVTLGSTLRAVRMDELRKDGKTFEEIGVCFKISRERVRQILKNFGFEPNQVVAQQQISSEELLNIEIKAKRQAFFYGVSIAQYLRLRSILGNKLLHNFKEIFRRNDRNLQYGRIKHYQGKLLMQISLVELVEIYIDAVRERIPNLPIREGLLEVTSGGSGFLLARVNHTTPATRENLIVCTRKEFGERFGKLYGIKGVLRKIG